MSFQIFANYCRGRWIFAKPILPNHLIHHSRCFVVPLPLQGKAKDAILPMASLGKAESIQFTQQRGADDAGVGAEGSHDHLGLLLAVLRVSFALDYLTQGG